MPRVDLGAIAQLLERYTNVVSAWVFGSGQSGEIRAGGDLDLGILFEAVPSLDERADLRAELQSVLSLDDIDLVVLNRASSVLRFEATSGRPVYCRDPSARASFVSLSAREYEDEMALAENGLRMRKQARASQDPMGGRKGRGGRLSRGPN
jgi:predicted nucleotidyltransferase